MNLIYFVNKRNDVSLLTGHMIIKMAALNILQILLMAGMLITGSINTLSKKAQNDCV